MTGVQSSYFYWSLALVCLVPIAIVLFNELIDRSRRQTSAYTDLLVMLRDIVLPLLVVVVLLRFVFEVSDDNLPTKFLSTLFWIALMVAVFRLTRRIVGNGNYTAEDWRSMVPHMFLRLPSYTILGLIVFHIIQNLWSFPVREMATTLGIGSIVIAFALQDTLSNLVSGVLLVANSPFKPGDWVHVGEVEGKITAVNWRYTHIETWSGDLVVIPNGSIAGESIENHSRPSRVTAVTQKFNIAFAHPPNQVRDLFAEVFNNTPGILAEPAPSVVITNIDDPSMEYESEFWIEDYGDYPDIHADFMARLWYAMHRHGIELPTPLYHLHSFNGLKTAESKRQIDQTRKSCLDWLPHFAELPASTRETLADHARYGTYAENEIVINRLETEPGLYVVVSGSVAMDSFTPSGDKHRDYLHAGEFFGETGLFGRAISPATVTAATDSDIICLSHDQINEALNRHPEFASSISAIVDQRRARKTQIEAGNQSTLSSESLPSLVESAGE